MRLGASEPRLVAKARVRGDELPGWAFWLASAHTYRTKSEGVDLGVGGLDASYPFSVSDGLSQSATVSVQDRTGRLRDANVTRLRDQACRALRELTKDAATGGSVRVVVVSDIEMSAAHERFSGVAGTTDVLTFDLREAGAGELDTDILICLDEAERVASERGHTPDRELLLYIVHGILHCLGHDDHDPVAYARMHAREDEVLEAIGVGRTFAQGGENSEGGV